MFLYFTKILHINSLSYFKQIIIVTHYENILQCKCDVINIIAITFSIKYSRKLVRNRSYTTKTSYAYQFDVSQTISVAKTILPPKSSLKRANLNESPQKHFQIFPQHEDFRYDTQYSLLNEGFLMRFLLNCNCIFDLKVPIFRILAVQLTLYPKY